MTGHYSGVRSPPLSLRLIRELHERLMSHGRGETQAHGEFRRTQNWIGGTRPGNAMHVPPPVSELNRCLDEFERFLHEDTTGLPPLIKAGLLHVQFESIHPFLDGNGRIGRLLVTLYLCVQRVVRNGNAPLEACSPRGKERAHQAQQRFQECHSGCAFDHSEKYQACCYAKYVLDW